MTTTTCDRCGAEIQIGDYPFCPHGRGAGFVESDDVPGGFVVENGFDRPTKFYSKSEHRAALAARGLEMRVKWAGPTDRHVKRWDAPSAKQLEDARILLSRGRISTPEPEEPDYPISVSEVKGPYPEGIEHG